VPISDAARSLISSILCKNPTDRPDLDQMLASDFLQMNAIPKTLPPSFLACPPSAQYIRQFKGQQNQNQTPNIATGQMPAKGSSYTASAGYLPKHQGSTPTNRQLGAPQQTNGQRPGTQVPGVAIDRM